MMTIANSPNSMHETADPLLAQFIARDASHCPLCRHPLHLTEGDCCAQCGEELILSIGVESSRLGLFITGLILLAGAVGLGLMICAIGIAAHLSSSIRQIWPFFIFGGGAVFASICIVLWIRGRRRFRSASRFRRALLAALAALPLVALIYFTLVID